MEKLTIEQLAPEHLIPYLNHKLQFEVEWSDKIKHKEVLTYIDISNNQIRLGVDNYYTLGLEDNIKPILHDLSSLTKPIIHEGYNNGEPFVPMVYLCENFCDRTPCNVEFGKSKILMHADNGGGLKWWFVYHRNKMTFELSDDNRDMTTHILPQYQMFQKLFEWNFNVFNIPSHLFIDKLNYK